MVVTVILCLLAIPALLYSFLYGSVSSQLIQTRKANKKLQEKNAKLEDMVETQARELHRVDQIRKRTEEGCLRKHHELEDAQAELDSLKAMLGI